MKKLAILILLLSSVIGFTGSSEAQGDNWWITCANQVWDGYCGTVESCCQNKYTICLQTAWNDNCWGAGCNLIGRLGDEKACRDKYNGQCITGALTCYDDPT